MSAEQNHDDVPAEDLLRPDMPVKVKGLSNQDLLEEMVRRGLMYADPLPTKAETLGAANQDAVATATEIVNPESSPKVAEVEVQAAPTPSPLAPSPAPMFKGSPIDVDPTAAAPGETVQLIHQFPPGTTLQGLVLGKGLEVVTVMVGRQKFPGDAPTWQGCYGRPVPDQSYTILLARNVTDETVIARATWWVTSGGKAAPAPGVSATASTVPAAAPAGPTGGVALPVPPNTAYAQGVVSYAHTGPAAAASAEGLPVAVIPGTNEVALLLQRSECERLVAALSGGLAISDHERAPILRQLRSALTR